MNIVIAAEQYNKARELKASGQEFKAASAYLDAQRFAIQCRSKKSDDLAFKAHVAAVLSADRVLKNSADHKERSEAGRIKSESSFIFQNSAR